MNGLTYQDMYGLAQSLASDSNSTNLTLLKDMIKQGQRELNSKLNIHHIEKTRDYTLQTDAISGSSNQAYNLPYDFKKVTDLYVTVDDNTYHATPVYNEMEWRELNSGDTSTSEYLQRYFVRGNRLEIFPYPSTTDTMTLVYQAILKDLSQDDYDTGTITTLAASGTSVTGSSTAWDSTMVGRYFKIDDDGGWYKISDVDSATSITLADKYQGAAISAGSEAYTIGEMPPTPPDTHILPIYYALWHFFMMKKDTFPTGREYKTMWMDGVMEAQANWGTFDSDQLVETDMPVKRRRFRNPNFYPKNLS